MGKVYKVLKDLFYPVIPTDRKDNTKNCVLFWTGSSLSKFPFLDSRKDSRTLDIMQMRLQINNGTQK